MSSVFKKTLVRTLKVLKYLFLAIFCLLLIAFLISFWPANKPEIDSNFGNRVVLINANIVDLENDSILTNHTLVIEGGLIKEILRNNDIPTIDQYEVIDLAGKYVMPGLTDMHVHLFDETDLYLYLTQGITTVRNLSGFPKHLKWANSVAQKELIGPRIFTSGPQLDGQHTAPNAYALTTIEGAVQRVRENAEKFDWLKVYDGLEYPVYQAILKEADNLGIKVASHVPRGFSIDSAIVAGLTTIEHFEELYSNPFKMQPDTFKIDHLSQLLLQYDVAVCPTIITIEMVNRMIEGLDMSYTSDSLDYMPSLVRRVSEGNINSWMNVSERTRISFEKQVNFHLLLLKHLHADGVTIIAGTDAPAQSVLPAFSLVDELLLYKQAGLSNHEVLKTATVNPASVLEVSDQYGIVKQGYVADLVITSRNPVEDLTSLRNPEFVIKAGTIYTKAQLEELRSHAKDHHRNILYNIRDFISQILYTR